MVYRANRLRGSLAARLERAERSEALRTNRLDEEGRIRVDPSTYALLQRLGELDPALLEAYFRAHYGHIRDPWQEAGHPPPPPESVQEAKNAFWELWREEHCRQLAEETGDRLILALWQAYACERDELRAGRYIHPACVSSDNGWLIRPESVEQKRPSNVFFWLSPFRRAVDDRKRALREEGATPIEDRTEAERLAGERAQEIVDGHMRHGQYLCDWLGIPFDETPDDAADRARS